MSNNVEKRNVKLAIKRGLQMRCPNCGSKTLFKSYLKTNDKCLVCKQELHHHRADDGPAYLTILLVGHILVPFLHVFYSVFHMAPIIMATLLSLIATALSLFLLPRFKGMIVGIQWANMMGGFGKEEALHHVD